MTKGRLLEFYVEVSDQVLFGSVNLHKLSEVKLSTQIRVHKIWASDFIYDYLKQILTDWAYTDRSQSIMWPYKIE